MVDDLKPRYTTKRLRQEIERARENDARHIAALEAQLAEVRAVADILTRNITENGLDNHRMKINGEWHEGPVVDTCRNLLVAIRQTILTALEAAPHAPKVTVQQAAQALYDAFPDAMGLPREACRHAAAGNFFTALLMLARPPALTAAQEAGKP